MICECTNCKNEATRLNAVMQEKHINLVDYRTLNVCDDCFYGWGFLTIDESADIYRRVIAGEEVNCDAGHNEFVRCPCGRVLRDVRINIVDGEIVCKPCRNRTRRRRRRSRQRRQRRRRRRRRRSTRRSLHGLTASTPASANSASPTASTGRLSDAPLKQRVHGTRSSASRPTA